MRIGTQSLVSRATFFANLFHTVLFSLNCKPRIGPEGCMGLELTLGTWIAVLCGRRAELCRRAVVIDHNTRIGQQIAQVRPSVRGAIVATCRTS